MRFDFRTNAHKLFTNVFHRYRQAHSRFVMLYGGASSSKSYSAHQSELINLLTASHDTLMIRKYASDLEGSCYKLLKQLATDYSLTNHLRFRYSNSSRDITCASTGRAIRFRGLDDPAKIKSIVGIRRIVIEEAEQITEKDFLELNRRARGVADIQIVFIFNPISKNHWIYDFFFNPDSKKATKYQGFRKHTTALHCTYKDNLQNLTKEDVEFLENLKYISPNQYKVYCLGEWGSVDTDRPFMYNFNHDKHVKPCSVQPGLPLYLSFDFNVDPATCLVRQGVKDWCYYVDEIRLKDSDPHKLCEVVNSRYSGYHYLVTGDASGRQRRFESRHNMSAWHQIKQLLQIPSSQLKIPGTNPHHSNSRVDCNIMLARFPDLRISPECIYLIDDMQSIEAKEDGTINKGKDAQKTHLMDCFRYDVNTWWTWFTKQYSVVERKNQQAA